MHIAEQKGTDKEEVNSFSEEAGFRLMPGGNVSNSAWEVVTNITVNKLLTTFDLIY